MKENQEDENTFEVYINNQKVIPYDVCPYCGNQASMETNILVYYEDDTSPSSFPLTEILVKINSFLLGLDFLFRKKVFAIKTCQKCFGFSLFYRCLEWTSRICGVIFTVSFMHSIWTPENTSGTQGIFIGLSAFGPFILGGIFGYIFMTLAEKRKGFAIVEIKKKKIWFQVKNSEWFRLYKELNESKRIQTLDNIEDVKEDNIIMSQKPTKDAEENIGQYEQRFSDFSDKDELLTILTRLAPHASELSLCRVVRFFDPPFRVTQIF